MSGLDGLDEKDLEELTKAIDFSDIGLGPPAAWETPRASRSRAGDSANHSEDSDGDAASDGGEDGEVDGPKLLTPSDVLDMAAYLGE